MVKVDVKAPWRNRPSAPSDLEGYPGSQLVDTSPLTNAFESFMADRQARLLAFIEQATGKDSYRGDVAEDGVDSEQDDDEIEAELIMAAAE